MRVPTQITDSQYFKVQIFNCFCSYELFPSSFNLRFQIDLQPVVFDLGNSMSFEDGSLQVFEQLGIVLEMQSLCGEQTTAQQNEKTDPENDPEHGKSGEYSIY